ncbi:hypothetical protein [Cryobacterium ruanii]|uniref:Uncharacterized protein n=1 Tax=Cryobacterium ruanii TaxID=1259197 RepID=A0A4R9AT37_9MICO|nr:hypothetical protein [Cryobacterium ruanii]TFD68492.1 hypothetical protein E3T47_03305 [Cryobacterium ruanii]
MGLFDGSGKVISAFEQWRARGGVEIQWTKTRVDGTTTLALMAPQPFFFYIRPKDGIVDLVLGTESGPYAGMKVSFEVGDNSTSPAQIIGNILVKMGELTGDIRDDEDDDESLDLGWVMVGFSLLLARGARAWSEHYRFVEQYMVPISLRMRGKAPTVSLLGDLLKEPLPASERNRLLSLQAQVAA